MHLNKKKCVGAKRDEQNGGNGNTYFLFLALAGLRRRHGGTVRKNKLFTKIDAKMIKYYIVKTKVEYQFFVDHIIFEPYFFL